MSWSCETLYDHDLAQYKFATLDNLLCLLQNAANKFLQNCFAMQTIETCLTDKYDCSLGRFWLHR